MVSALDICFDWSGSESWLIEIVVLCSWSKYLTPTDSLIAQVHKYVPANLVLGVTLRWTIRPCILLARLKFQLTNQHSAEEGKVYCPDVSVSQQDKYKNQVTFLTGDGIKYSQKRDLQFQTETYQIVKRNKIWSILCLQAPSLLQKRVAGVRHSNSLAVCQASPGRKIVVSFSTECAVPRQIKPGILKLTIGRGQSNFSITCTFVSFEGKEDYLVVSVDG